MKNKTLKDIYSLSAELFALTFDWNDSVKDKFLLFNWQYFCWQNSILMQPLVLKYKKKIFLYQSKKSKKSWNK